MTRAQEVYVSLMGGPPSTVTISPATCSGMGVRTQNLGYIGKVERMRELFACLLGLADHHLLDVPLNYGCLNDPHL